MVSDAGAEDARRDEVAGRGSGARSGQSGTVSDAESRLKSFISAHGEGCIAVINYVGRVGSRIVIIAPDGRFGDVLASSQQAAEEICTRLDLPVRQWDRETTGLLAPSEKDRVLMGSRQR